MEDNLKEKLKKAAQDAEVKAARSLLRWKYQKEGKTPPGESELEEQSRQVAGQARQVIARSSRTIWSELKKVYLDARSKQGKDKGSKS